MAKVTIDDVQSIVVGIPTTIQVIQTTQAIQGVNLISFNMATQLPFKLTPSNFPSWHALFISLLWI